MSIRRPPAETSSSLTRLIGWFYVVIGAAGMVVLLFAPRPAGIELLDNPLVVIGAALLFLLLIVIGLVLGVLKRDPKLTFID